MVIIMERGASQEQIDHVVKRIEAADVKAQPSVGEELYGYWSYW